MATPTADEARDQALDMFTQVQEAGLRLAGTVAETWGSVLRSAPGLASGAGAGAPLATDVPATGLPHTAIEIVDRFYDTGVQVLEAQRAAVHHVLGAVAPALRPLTVATPPFAHR